MPRPTGSCRPLPRGIVNGWIVSGVKVGSTCGSKKICPRAEAPYVSVNQTPSIRSPVTDTSAVAKRVRPGAPVSEA